MKRQFAVSCSKSLGRQRNYVLTLDFEQHHISLLKNRGAKGPKTFSFAECTKLEKERKDPRKLSLTFSRNIGKEVTTTSTTEKEKEGYKKTVVFSSTEDRELFCNLVHAVIITGPKAAQLFKKLDRKNSGSLSLNELIENNYVNLICVSALQPNHGTYTRDQIVYLFCCAYTAFHSAYLEASNAGYHRLAINTGNWGCGAFGGNLELTAIIQILTANAAKIDILRYHPFDENGTNALMVGNEIATRLIKKDFTTDQLIDSLFDMGYTWGTSNNT